MKAGASFLSALLAVLLSPAFQGPQGGMTSIMGESSLEPESMYAYLTTNNKANGINPVDSEYAKAFVIATIQESEAEGVRADVAFALMMHETGFLNFGGDVLPSQNNFGGLGATGSGAKGATFKDMRQGIRAVVQHLKCYASKEPLALELVDPRWSESLRGKAQSVELLGRADNPSGTGWASPGNGYGSRLVSMMSVMSNLDTSSVATITVPAFSGEDTSAGEPSGEGSMPVQPSGFSFSALLVPSLPNLVNFSLAALLLTATVFVARFRSRFRA